MSFAAGHRTDDTPVASRWKIPDPAPTARVLDNPQGHRVLFLSPKKAFEILRRSSRCSGNCRVKSFCQHVSERKSPYLLDLSPPPMHSTSMRFFAAITVSCPIYKRNCYGVGRSTGYRHPRRSIWPSTISWKRSPASGSKSTSTRA
jgi:hypothetical protein